MQVEAPQLRCGEKVRWEDATVSDGQRERDIVLVNPLCEHTITYCRWLHDRKTKLVRAHLHRGRREDEATTGGLVGLAHDSDDVADRCERLETRDRDLGRSEEDSLY